jgi:hypothetical protein
MKITFHCEIIFGIVLVNKVLKGTSEKGGDFPLQFLPWLKNKFLVVQIT